MERLALVASGALGFLAVALGAFGAHGLKSRLAPLADGATRLEWWSTGALYHLVHALALAAVGYLAGRAASSTAVVVAGGAFVVGVVLFSGSLYTMALTGTRALGMITPLGGVGFLVGWAAVAVAAWSLPPSPKL
ncbi:MAG: DUF423 domain-containing protein [Labilithrix sp.]|nr:DUF423 domain-containing protein [Labilithrix sp.]MCW5831810.1 DUF423 domain-containing protein [Labilithrix sp.]